nr:MAG TPA_asm: hypothetical protein [Caudoviricetes sp.]
MASSPNLDLAKLLSNYILYTLFFMYYFYKTH